MTVFITTHYLDEADALCDRIAIIDNGEIVAEGTPDELKHEIAGDVVEVNVAGDLTAAERLFDRPRLRAQDGSIAGQGVYGCSWTRAPRQSR